jgi:hypothetical protein
MMAKQGNDRIRRKKIAEEYLITYKIPERKIGSYRTKQIILPAHSCTTGALTKRMTQDKRTLPPLLFDRETRWHELFRLDQLIDTDVPARQYEVDRLLIDGFNSGTVLAGGLGCGYAVIELARHPGVQRVVVVEKSLEVIKLVEETIMEQVEKSLFKEDIRAEAKVQIVHDDLANYLRTAAGSSDFVKFDWAFYNIWTDNSMTSFFECIVPLLELSVNAVRRRPVCLGEDFMRNHLLECLDNTLKYRAEDPLLWEASSVPNGNIFHDWCVPFFRFIKKINPAAEQFHLHAEFYVSIYGLPDWESSWKLYEEVQQ